VQLRFASQHRRLHRTNSLAHQTSGRGLVELSAVSDDGHPDSSALYAFDDRQQIATEQRFTTAELNVLATRSVDYLVRQPA